jgi:signal transduction histidine kinase
MTPNKKKKGKKTAAANRKDGSSRCAEHAGEIFPLISDEVLGLFPEPVILYSADAGILYANKPAAESIGFDPSGISTDEFRERIMSRTKDVSRADRNYLFSTWPHGELAFRNALFRFRGAGDKTRTVIASSVPVTYSDSTNGTIVTWHDITEQVEREELIIMAKDTLESILSEKTADLIKAREFLDRERRLSEIGTLAAMIAHELRNPLGVIRTAAYNIRRKSDDPRLGRHLDNIDKKIEESARIISNILNYSRINDPAMQPVHLAGLLVDCIHSTRKKYLRSTVRISRRLAGIKGLTIEADSGQIKEVFLNILNNAVEAIEGEGLVTVQACSRDGGIVEIKIEDDGVGIDEGDLERIFDPFYSKKTRGTGLGLAVCRKLIDLHRGDIEVRSLLGEGTKVIVSLPVKGEPNEDRKDTGSRG